MPETVTKKQLRLITYMSPGIQVELYETIRDYLEQVTGLETSLRYESRFDGPPLDRINPFTENEVDIGFMTSSAFTSQLKNGNQHMELCKAAAYHLHKKNTARPIYFGDVIIRKDDETKYKEFYDLRGHKWAYNKDSSLSGNLIVLEHLKKMGFNSSFFGNILLSGSHLNSIKMVLDHAVDAASIDSNVLASFFNQHPDQQKKLVVLTSLGPCPSYPVVFNTSLPDDLKETITAALLEMGTTPDWAQRLHPFKVGGFLPTDMSLYDMQTVITESIKGLSIATAYY
ncbi:hypothetical protein ACJMK2_012860 [Sinanodonta woodiana]|uniref:Uncharacterized protein n=1 Tax=Sinanodonta woodiana TaxID=1069815 RepID=A0ABD3V9K7_SINWO